MAYEVYVYVRVCEMVAILEFCFHDDVKAKSIRK